MKRTAIPNVIEFGPFVLDRQKQVLTCRGEFLPVPPKELELLSLLTSQPREVIAKSTIMERIWPGTFVEEGNLARHISFLRQRLTQHGDGSSYIETIPKRGYRFNGLGPATGDQAQGATLVVLPFANLSGTSAHDYFADGFTEEMITRISRWDPKHLRVIARTSAMAYRNSPKSIVAIGKELRATHALEGSIRREGERVRISARLVQTSRQSQLWSETYDRRLSDVLRLQAEVAVAITEQLKRQFAVSIRSVARPSGTEQYSPAYDVFLRGRELFHQRTEHAMRQSIQLFRQCIDLDRGFALGYCGLADAYSMLVLRGMAPPRSSLRNARKAISTALAIAPDSGEAFCSLAFVRLLAWDWERLEDDFLRAIELNPAQPIVYCWYGKYLTAVGRLQQGIAMSEKARLSDPFAPQIAAAVGWAQYLARQPQPAIRTLSQTIKQQPLHFLPRLKLSMVFVQTGRCREALVQAREAVRLADQSTETLAALAMVYSANQERAAARAIIADLLRPRRLKCVFAYNIARIHAAGGDAERTLDWLAMAYDERDPDMAELGCDPLFDFVRATRRFQSLLTRVGLTGAMAKASAGNS